MISIIEWDVFQSENVKLRNCAIINSSIERELIFKVFKICSNKLLN